MKCWFSSICLTRASCHLHQPRPATGTAGVAVLRCGRCGQLELLACAQNSQRQLTSAPCDPMRASMALRLSAAVCRAYMAETAQSCASALAAHLSKGPSCLGLACDAPMHAKHGAPLCPSAFGHAETAVSSEHETRGSRQGSDGRSSLSALP
jgi:hypothetical protein